MSTKVQPSFITRRIGAALLLLTAFAGHSRAQVAGGNLAGAILDPKGAAIAKAKVEIENLATGVTNTVVSEGLGQYRFDNLLVGTYKVTASASGFRPGSVTAISVQLSTTASANITLQIGAVTDSVTVTDAGSLIDAVTAQITNLFPASMVSTLAVSANPTGGYNNLALLGAGVASPGGVGVGTGPSVGGARTRDNNNMVEGADNNRKDVTGPVIGVPIDMVAEFSVLQNQFSAEFGHASGGQFNAVVKSGTNNFHGGIYEYFQNRYLNAQDEAIKRLDITTQRPRYDQNILGGTFGGPIQEDRLFFFGGFDYNPLGRATPVQRWAPTADGYNTLQSMTTVSQTNLGILKQYAGAARVQDQDYTETIRGVDVPIGLVGTLVPSYQAAYRGASSMDFNMTDKDQWRGRYIFNHSSGIDSAAQFPAFWTSRPISSHLASVSEVHTFSPTLQSEARLAYTRYDDRRDVPGVAFPGLDAFPSIAIRDLGLQIGPNVNSPQTVVQNVYQLVENLTWNKGNHSVKVGFDGRDSISRLDVVSGAFGDYQYNTLDRYLADLVPNSNASRSSNIKPYYGNAMAFYLYGNDNWKVTRNLTVNLGLRWEYNGVAKSMKEFANNSIADVPGVLTFFAPTAQKKNFAPRLGFAYSPGHSGKTSIRGGFGMAYDQIFDNIGNNVRPPESSLTTSVSTSSTAKNFLGTGGIGPVVIPTVWTPDSARAATVGWLPNQKLGYAVTWNFGIQHVFGKDYVVDVRYLGTRGVHLLLQTSLNRNAIVTATHNLPTYLSQPSAAELNALTLTTTQLGLEKNSALGNPLAPYGFTNAISTGITSYVPQGNSIYHGLAIDVTKRFSGQFMFKTGYTWSHLMDDSTTEVNFTTLSPRRPQDFGNLTPEWASSALDRRQRFTFTSQWDSPWFKHNQNWFLRTVVGNYSLSGTYTAESPQYVTPQSAVDSNLNGDSASDRVIVNTAGVVGRSSDVTPLKNSAGATVAYLAIDPTAQYIRAASGAYANSGRNLLPTQGINNVDLSASKFFPVGENKRIEVRADFYNALNHAQYTPGRINNVLATTHVGETVTLTPGNPLFAQFNQLYPSNSRFIQLVAKFSW